VKISPQTLAFLQRVAAKLTEKSSVAGYLAVLAAVLPQLGPDVAKLTAVIVATAGIALFLLSDTQIQAWLTGQKSLPPVSVPQDKPSSDQG
jgi:hypothetical protein